MKIKELVETVRRQGETLLRLPSSFDLARFEAYGLKAEPLTGLSGVVKVGRLENKAKNSIQALDFEIIYSNQDWSLYSISRALEELCGKIFIQYEALSATPIFKTKQKFLSKVSMQVKLVGSGSGSEEKIQALREVLKRYTDGMNQNVPNERFTTIKVTLLSLEEKNL